MRTLTFDITLIDPAKLGFPKGTKTLHTWALARLPLGDEWLICDEGVVCFRVDNQFGPIPVTIRTKSKGNMTTMTYGDAILHRDEIHAALTNEMVSLHDFIRVFGPRLETNYHDIIKEAAARGMECRDIEHNTTTMQTHG